MGCCGTRAIDINSNEENNIKEENKLIISKHAKEEINPIKSKTEQRIFNLNKQKKNEEEKIKETINVKKENYINDSKSQDEEINRTILNEGNNIDYINKKLNSREEDAKEKYNSEKKINLFEESNKAEHNQENEDIKINEENSINEQKNIKESNNLQKENNQIDYDSSSSEEDSEFDKFLLDYANNRVNLNNMSSKLKARLESIGYFKLLEKENQLNESDNSEETPKVKYNVSFRCYYDIKDTGYTQIINKGENDVVNQEIEAKIKILENNKVKNLIFQKKFDKIGMNTVEFLR